MNAVSVTMPALNAYSYLPRVGCGDVSDIQANGGLPAPETDCTIPCAGDPIHLCGGAERLQLYEWVGTPLNVWHTPAVTGFYEVSVSFVFVNQLVLTHSTTVPDRRTYSSVDRDIRN